MRGVSLCACYRTKVFVVYYTTPWILIKNTCNIIMHCGIIINACGIGSIIYRGIIYCDFKKGISTSAWYLCMVMLYFRGILHNTSWVLIKPTMNTSMHCVIIINTCGIGSIIDRGIIDCDFKKVISTSAWCFLFMNMLYNTDLWYLTQWRGF